MRWMRLLCKKEESKKEEKKEEIKRLVKVSVNTIENKHLKISKV